MNLAFCKMTDISEQNNFSVQIFRFNPFLTTLIHTFAEYKTEVSGENLSISCYLVCTESSRQLRFLVKEDC